MAAVTAVSGGYKYRIFCRVGAAKRNGTQQNALIEALEVAAEMAGGSGPVYAMRALEVFRTL
jgi:alkylhydroperoxidase/carboxymuconolactone decarboxylase family protein YurZ